MKSYFLMSIRLSQLIKMLVRNKGISLRYALRLIPLIMSGMISEIFRLAEQIKFGKLLDRTSLPEDPIFIVSHWRTGSTLLHELVALDENLVSPTFLDTIIPDHFLVSSRYYRNFVGHIVGKTRPIDNFAINIDSPNEHEFALLKMSGHSPIQGTIFSSNDTSYFLNRYTSFIPELSDEKSFKNAYLSFISKIHVKNGKRIVLKNPCDSLRISWLKELFPGSKFIHIRRNPYNVVPSTIKMWETVFRDNLLKGRYIEPSFSEVALFYEKMENTISSELAMLPESDHASMNYEDLVSDPVGTVAGAFQQLKLDMSTAHKHAILRYMLEKKSNQSPPRVLMQSQKDEIYRNMKDYFEKYYPTLSKD